MKTLVAIILLLSLVIVPASAKAAPSEGELLFREGRTAMQEKDYERACTKFAESHKLEPAPGTALNLGECEERRGHLVAAYDAFTLAASAFTTADKQKYATSRADAIDKRIPRLTIRSSVPIAGLVVHAGQITLNVETETKLDPGEVTIHAEAPNKKPKDLRATLREGKSLEVDIGSLDPSAETTIGGSGAATTTTVIATPPKQGNGLRTIGIIVGGAGAVSLIVGGVTGVLALDRASTVKEHCNEALACDAEGVDAASSGDTLSLLSTITVAAGSALLIGGVVLFLVAPKASATTAATTTRIVPMASQDRAGLMFRGVF